MLPVPVEPQEESITILIVRIHIILITREEIMDRLRRHHGIMRTILILLPIQPLIMHTRRHLHRILTCLTLLLLTMVIMPILILIRNILLMVVLQEVLREGLFLLPIMLLLPQGIIIRLHPVLTLLLQVPESGPPIPTPINIIITTTNNNNNSIHLPTHLHPV